MSRNPSAPRPEPCAFVIFGATGDLAARKLIPALWTLHREGALHPRTQVIGYARSEIDETTLRRNLRTALAEQAGAEPSDEAWEPFAARIRYVRGGYDDVGGFGRLGEALDALELPRRLFYTATPPNAYAGIADALHATGLNRAPDGGWTRLVVEKPFGHDLDSARALNRRLREAFDEDQILRIDHYLAKETAQNLAVLRFANALFEPMWSRRTVDHVQITMTEPMGVEGRGSFYEEAGVIRDVFQNHLLQLLALVAMEPPARWRADDVRDEKVKVLNALSCPDPEASVFGQYARGGGHAGYREEEGVDPDSNQATYAAVRFEIRNGRWSGVPFFVRSGKRLRGKASEIVLVFSTPAHVPFDLQEPLAADRLVLRVAPDEGIRIDLNAKRPGTGIRLGRVGLDFTYDGRFDRPPPDAYETLLQDAMHGDATLFMRADEVEAQWRLVEPLLARGDAGPPHLYPAGGDGPAAADALIGAHGRAWHAPSLEGERGDRDGEGRA